MTPKEAAKLVGRMIVSVDLDATWEGEGANRVRMHDPTILLDDGSRLRFLTEEHPSGDSYGVDIIHIRTRKKI